VRFKTHLFVAFGDCIHVYNFGVILRRGESVGVEPLFGIFEKMKMGKNGKIFSKGCGTIVAWKVGRGELKIVLRGICILSHWVKQTRATNLFLT
jgi:hypothetical protein